MPRKGPGAKVKGLGRELRLLRERTGKKQFEGAEALGISVQSYSRLESGQRNISEGEVIILLTLYGVTGPKREQLVMMARTLDDPGWWEHDMPGLTQESATLADYEERASRITSWAPLIIPGLLQTMSYSRAYMLDDGIEPAEVEGRLTTRLRRQHRLTRPDVDYVAFIGEPAFAGLDSTVAREQFAHLLAMTARPNVAIHVVLLDRLPYSCRRGSFLALDLAEEESVVHVELARSGVFLDEPLLTDPYRRTLDRVRGVALSETESEVWISHRKDEMER